LGKEVLDLEKVLFFIQEWSKGKRGGFKDSCGFVTDGDDLRKPFSSPNRGNSTVGEVPLSVLIPIERKAMKHYGERRRPLEV